MSFVLNKLEGKMTKNSLIGRNFIFLALKTLHHPNMILLHLLDNPCCNQTIENCKSFGIKRMGVTLGETSRDTLIKLIRRV